MNKNIVCFLTICSTLFIFPAKVFSENNREYGTGVYLDRTPHPQNPNIYIHQFNRNSGNKKEELFGTTKRIKEKLLGKKSDIARIRYPNIDFNNPPRIGDAGYSEYMQARSEFLQNEIIHTGLDTEAILEYIDSEDFKGEKGDKGDRGEQGLQGIQGERGSQGERGLNGKDGREGKDGVKGDKGDRGEQGLQGIQGERGAQGERGLNGKNGARGDKGDRGFKGDKGDRGRDGVIPEEKLKKIRVNTQNIDQLTDDLAVHKSQTEVWKNSMTSRVTGLEGRTTALEGRMTRTEEKVGKLEKRMKGNAAANAALMQTANVPQKGNVLALSFGTGHHEGANAIAIGVAGATGLNPKVTMGYRIGVAVSPQQRGPTVGVGTTFFFE